jgi:flavodoxin
MKTLIVYESMFGNTRRIAEALAQALDAAGVEATVTPAASAPTDVSGFDLVIVGAPTHAHSLPRPSSREQAANWAADPAKHLVLEEHATGAGVREWTKSLELSTNPPRFAAFSTRADIPRLFAGDATVAIAKQLERLGAEVDPRMDFLMDPEDGLVDGELDRARDWAEQFAAIGR